MSEEQVIKEVKERLKIQESIGGILAKNLLSIIDQQNKVIESMTNDMIRLGVETNKRIKQAKLEAVKELREREEISDGTEA